MCIRDRIVQAVRSLKLTPAQLMAFLNDPKNSLTASGHTCLLYTSNRETGHMGQNYFRSLFAVGFQGLLILVCVAIYAVLIQSIATDGDPIGAIWGCVGYTAVSYTHLPLTDFSRLCFFPVKRRGYKFSRAVPLPEMCIRDRLCTVSAGNHPRCCVLCVA